MTRYFWMRFLLDFLSTEVDTIKFFPYARDAHYYRTRESYMKSHQPLFSATQLGNFSSFMTAFLLFVFCSFHTILPANIYPKPTPVIKYLKEISLAEEDSGFPGVDCIYVINLDRRPEKWERVNTLLKDQGMHGNRVSAVDGWGLTEEMQAELAGTYPVRMLGGEVGCLLSHISTIKDAYERGHHVAWIFEDDIEFTENPHQLSALIKKLDLLDPGWDVLYTDVDSKNSSGKTILALASDFRPDRTVVLPLAYYLFRTRVSQDFLLVRQRYGLYSYIVSRKGMKKIYDYFSHVYLWTAVDIDIHYIPGIRQYSTTHDVVSIWCHSPFSDTKQN